MVYLDERGKIWSIDRLPKDTWVWGKTCTQMTRQVSPASNGGPPAIAVSSPVRKMQFGFVVFAAQGVDTPAAIIQLPGWAGVSPIQPQTRIGSCTGTRRIRERSLAFILQ